LSDPPYPIDLCEDNPRAILHHTDRVGAPPEGGQVVKYDLDELVAGISDDNRHDLIDFGEPVGLEAW